MNRHLKIALFMAPFLALMTYGLTGFYYEPQLPKGDYQLTMAGDCQPFAGSCVFRSGAFEMTLISSLKTENKQLALLPNQTLQTLSLALADDTGQYRQIKMIKLNDGKYWQTDLGGVLSLDNFSYFRLAMSAEASQYYIEVEVNFNGN